MKGFTLIEILIVVAISVMLATIAVVYTGVTRNVAALSTETAQVAGSVFRAKELALSTYASNGPPGSPLICGYGASFDVSAQTYSIFAYEPSPTDYPNIPTTGGVLNYCPTVASTTATGVYSSEMAETVPGAFNVSLPADVRMVSGGNDLAIVLFIPPDPAVLIGPAPIADPTALLPQGSASTTYDIYLESADGSETSTVVVNGAGQVSF